MATTAQQTARRLYVQVSRYRDVRTTCMWIDLGHGIMINVTEVPEPYHTRTRYPIKPIKRREKQSTSYHITSDLIPHHLGSHPIPPPIPYHIIKSHHTTSHPVTYHIHVTSFDTTSPHITHPYPPVHSRYTPVVSPL